MSVDINKVISWFDNHMGKITYSMYGSRNGSDGTGDCSGTITQALYEAGASKPAYLYSTETIHPYLTNNGFSLYAENTSWTAKRGDIVVMGKRGESAGAFGHIGVISTDDPNALLLSTSFWTGGESGTAVGNVKFDEMWEADGSPYFYVYRQIDSNQDNVAPAQPAPVSSIQQFKNAGNHFTNTNTFKVDKIAQVNGIWQMINYALAGGTDADWTLNGIPLDIVDNVTRGDAPTQVGDSMKFSSGYDNGTIDEYDDASNGVGIVFSEYGIVWFNADAFIKL
ncbi:peptidoglycan hydrolase [Leuconostoc mesenteroides]|uniref:peptidoglycan amidohydrolase family protein n=1 Tax=Leuconostoc mesenteroides TaxID=1245 RepID=UPI001CBB2150|nr:peptidoglycan amidohydrolase family protein [Leuconostoc mesenteroides]MBZ1517627.1 peptidoglycan hydrolase [Leuconostoc mesenteroides]MBZ1520336.1 peptidoglycan hydrolase [Leuconostoc mesenteroides]